MSVDRRQLLGGAGALMMLASCGRQGGSSSNQIEKIGIQTYTLRDAMGEDARATFQMIKDVGFDYVELNGRDFSTVSPKALRDMLDDIGLPSPTTHLDYDSLANRTSEVADTAAALGCEYVVLPWLTEDQRGLDDYKAHAELLNRAAEALKASGINVAYHNHQFEFFDLGGGQTGMNILLSETDSDLVSFELDMFWAALAGSDIVGLFKANPGRFKLCHIKDLSGDASPWRTSVDFGSIISTLMVNVGEGDLPFESYFAANDVSGMKYFIAEHDNPPTPYRQSIETSYNAIRNMRF